MESKPTDGGRRAKLFWTGRSQAVRLPKEFRFEGSEVEIRRQGVAVILEPVRRVRLPDGYWERIDNLASGLEFPDVEPLGATLLEIDLDEDS